MYLGRYWKMATATHMRDQDGVLGSWFWPRTGLAIVGIWGLNQQMKDLNLSQLCHFAFQMVGVLLFYVCSHKGKTIVF